MDSLRHLKLLHEALSHPQDQVRTRRYAIPGRWFPTGHRASPASRDPFALYASVTGAVLNADPVPLCGSGQTGGGWCREAVVYNMLVRLTCAYDHDGDGVLGLPVNGDGWRETGSFLKAIAILPYIRSLGANTIHLLPVQQIGMDGRRGTLGSPYAVRDPLAIDPSLGEPNTGVPAMTEFAAFLEAARHSGFRVIVEIPLRTLSKDAAWVEDNPEWFYWIRSDRKFAPPRFDREEIAAATRKIEAGDREGLPPPSAEYRGIFTAPPQRGAVRLDGVRWSGTLPDGQGVVVPGAFADWPPDDHQPVWDDVTYLKLYQDPRFNYPAYNTVRMYDSSLLHGDSATATLWEKLGSVVAAYAGMTGVDGIMIDMAHALPEPLVRRLVAGARDINPGFSFWAEDFSRTPGQVSVGFDAVLGGQWACQHNPVDFASMLDWISGTPQLLPHLATPETHNTPRAAGRKWGARYSRYAWTISCFIPGIPFIHSGFELYEIRPVNTGLGFTPRELASFPTEELPLFSPHALSWSQADATVEWVARPLGIRARFNDCILPVVGAECRIVDPGDRRVLAFIRSNRNSGHSLLIVGNSDLEHRVDFTLRGVTPRGGSWTDLLSGESIGGFPGGVNGGLDPGQVFVFELTGS